jgi:hypothetical protein
MTTMTSSETNEETQSSGVDLDGCYRPIGISAVAAALHYQSDGKNPAYAPQDREASVAMFEEDAAT